MSPTETPAGAAPNPEPPAATERSARRFLLTFVATFLIGASLLYGVCHYANPWGNHGLVGYHLLYNARWAKVEHMETLPRKELPEVVVLGSSNTMRYDPAKLSERLGLRAFNFGVFWGKAEDFLCITQYFVQERDWTPKLLFIGLDPWSFRPPRNEHPIFDGIRRRLLNVDKLIQFHPDVSIWKLHWAKFIDAFSAQQLGQAYSVLTNDKANRRRALTMLESPIFADNGMRIRFADVYGDAEGNIFDSVEDGTYPVTSLLDEIIRTRAFRKLNTPLGEYRFDEFWEPRVGYLHELLELCQARDIQVAFVINPVHPSFLKLLETKSTNPANLAHLQQLLEDCKQRYSVIRAVYNAADITAFDGDPSGFYDAFHPATRNCDKVIEIVCKEIGKL